MTTPLPTKPAEEPSLFFIPLLDTEFDELEGEETLALEQLFH